MADERLEGYHDPKWALHERIFAAYVRANADQLGIDAGLFITGQAIVCIQGDDANIFHGLQLLRGTPQYSGTANNGRLDLLERLDWELTDGNLTPDINEQLRIAQRFIKGNPWTGTQATERAYEVWEKARDYVVEKCEANPHLKQALEYYCQNRSRIQAPTTTPLTIPVASTLVR